MAGVWWSLMIGSIVGCVLAGILILRWLFLNATKLRGRGLKKYRGKGMKSIVYEPHFKDREFISQYLLVQNRKSKFVTFKKGINLVSDIDLDVFVFDENDKRIAVLNIVDSVSRNGRTKMYKLPFNTAYVTVRVNSADGMRLNDSEAEKSKVSFNKKINTYALLLMALCCLEAFFVRFCVAKLFGGIYTDGFLLNGASIFLTILLSLVLAILITIFVREYIKYKSEKAEGRDKQ